MDKNETNDETVKAENPLGTKSVGKLLLEFSGPAIVGMIVNALYNVVDRIYIGNSNVGMDGIGGITIAFPIMIILLAMGLLFGIGGATLFSMRLGQGKHEEAEEALGNAFTMLLGSGVLFMILGQIFLVPILELFGAQSEILTYSQQYMRVIFFGAIFQILSIGMNHFLRADGRPQMAMITMFMGAGTNIVLDPVFIFGLNMGVAGAAWATIISQCVSAIWVVSYFLGKRSNHKIRPKNMVPKPKLILKITSLGLPAFLMQLANSMLNAILNKTLLLYGGDLAVSAMGVVNSVQTMLLMPITGLNQGLQPIVSFNFGAKKYDRVKQAVKLAIMVATAIVVVGFAAVQLFPRTLVSMFNREADMLRFGSYALRSWFTCLPLIGFQIIAANFFQAIGRSKSAMFLVLTRQVILLIPAIVIFGKVWGLDGVLYAAPFADLGATCLTSIWFFIGYRSLGVNKTEVKLQDQGI